MVLLILAAVAITAITEYNIIENANSAAQKYGDQANSENTTLGSYNTEIDKYIGGAAGGTGSGEGSGSGTGTGTVQTIAFADAQKAEMLQKTVNSKVFDEFGNQIVVPAGFKIRVDETTNNADNVTKGIVIEDESGNQFVWVPVGTIYTNAEKTELKTITLGRYYNFTATDGVYTPAQTASDYETVTKIDVYYTEDTTSNHTKDNAIARNIGDFVNSSMQNGGYYIGRFEAGKDNNNTLVCKAGQTVYGDITQPDSSTLCKNMYNNGADGYNAGTFSSDLINSYAWDTAIIFIQTFGGESDYYNQNNSTYFRKTGENGDEYCNINDMSGNAWEWTTETFGISNHPCVYRGGSYDKSGETAGSYTSCRNYDYSTYTPSILSFRPLLYVAL